MDNKSPIIPKLLSNYPKVFHEFYSLDCGFSTVMNAHNLINSYSSFAQTGIFFNDIIDNLWEYDFKKKFYLKKIANIILLKLNLLKLLLNFDIY